MTPHLRYTVPELQRLIAFAIDVARSNLECHCLTVDPETSEAVHGGWYDLTPCLPGGKEHEFMADALWILRHHDQLITHPTKPHLVRLKPAAPTTTGDTPNV